MSQCNKCQNQDLEWKEGTAKTGKNLGKPWKAWYCKPFKNMMFVNDRKSSNGNFKDEPAPNLVILNAKIDKILGILQANFKVPVSQRTEILKEEIPDLEESPF